MNHFIVNTALAIGCMSILKEKSFSEQTFNALEQSHNLNVFHPRQCFPSLHQFFSSNPLPQQYLTTTLLHPNFTNLLPFSLENLKKSNQHQHPNPSNFLRVLLMSNK